MISENYLNTLYDRYASMADIISKCQEVEAMMENVEAKLAEIREVAKRVDVSELLKARKDWYMAEQNISFMSFIAGGISDSCNSVRHETYRIGLVIADERDRVVKRLEELHKEAEATQEESSVIDT